MGLAVDDIKGVQDNAVLERLSIQVKNTLSVEYRLPRFIRSKFLKKKRSIRPNQYRGSSSIVKFLMSEQYLDPEDIKDAIKPEKVKCTRI